jgi:cellulose synthase/poly-beta-1,6-N-acetylglucosamine synthase-like glycosyltransferase
MTAWPTLLTLLNLVGWFISALFCVPVTILVLQVVMAVIARGRQADINRVLVEEPPQKSPRFVVLMPAHNEAIGILAAINSVLPQLQPGDRLVVVADNCTDNTAALARAAGAHVIERHDDLRGGKGHALDFGVRHIDASHNPPDVLVVVDADCQVAPNALAALVQTSAVRQRPVQALNLMHAPVEASIKTRVAEFAWVVKNHVRPLGYARLGNPCQLMGTGMAFPWQLIRGASLASSSIVEDMQLGLEMTRAGAAPLFLPSAKVSSQFPTHTQNAVSQRTRWECGHLSVITTHAPRLLKQAITRRQWALLALVLDLCVPPLASLFLALTTWTVLSSLLWVMADLSLPTVLAASALVGLGIAVTLSWWAFARHVISAAGLLSIPRYIISKVPIYLNFLLKKTPLDWVRTHRDNTTTIPASTTTCASSD